MDSAFVAPADALGLLTREARHWLPAVIGLSMLGAVPEIALTHFAPDPMELLSNAMVRDSETLVATLSVLALTLCLRFVIELLTFMLTFIVLADLTAGRTPDLTAGLTRLASWRLQGAWLVAGLFEQAAISAWFLGGALVLVPFGLVTAAAYEEDNGFRAFPRSVDLGLAVAGPGAMGRPGVRLAVGVTLGFFVGMLLNMATGLLTCGVSGVGTLPAIIDAVQSGDVESLTGLQTTSLVGEAMTLLFAPIALLPTVYMMTLQQMTYWRARSFSEQAGQAAPRE